MSEPIDPVQFAEERRQLARQAAYLIGVVLGVTMLVPTFGAWFTLSNQDLPAGAWALIAPALVLPALVVCALAPRVGAVIMVALSLVSTVALVLWVYRVDRFRAH